MTDRMRGPVENTGPSPRRNVEPWMTITVEIFKLEPDPRSPRWKFMARFADGLQPEFPDGRGETVAEAIRVAAGKLEPRTING